MKKGVVKKSIVLGIIMLFFGGIILPIISSTLIQDKNEKNITIDKTIEKVQIFNTKKSVLPKIVFIKDEPRKSLIVASVELDLDWSDIGFWDGFNWSTVPNHSNGIIYAGDRIYDDYGIINLKWIPTDTILGNWTFIKSTNISSVGLGNGDLQRIQPEWTYSDGGNVISSSVSSDGTYIAVKTSYNILLFNKNSNIPIWNINTGNNMGWVSISSDGSYIAASAYNQLRFYNGAGTLLWSHTISGFINCLSMSSDGEYIVIGGYDSHIVYLFDKDSSTPLWTYSTNGEVWGVDISSDGNYIVSGGYDDHNLYFFQKDSSTPQWFYTSDDYFYQAVTISPDGNYICAGDTIGIIYLFEKDNNIPEWTYATGCDYNDGLDMSFDGNYFAVASNTNIYFFQKDSSTPQWIRTGATMDELRMSYDGLYFTGGGNNKIYYFSKNSNIPLWSYQTGGSVVTASMSSNGAYIAGGGAAQYLYFFHYELESPIADFSWFPTFPNQEDTIIFDASTSDDPDGTIVAYEWDMDNDGQYDDTTGVNPTWQYPEGEYDVSLRVTDNDGLTGIKTRTVYVGVDELPSIEEITITGLPSDYTNNPVTKDISQTGDEKVKLEATIDDQVLGYEVTKVTWSGDIPAGDGNPYEYEADEGTHGTKKVMCTITYKNLVTEEIKSDISLEKEFNLFFIKTGNDDNDNEPNWFEYWKNDDIIPGLSQCEYISTFLDRYGQYDPAIDTVQIGPYASTNNFVVTIPDLGLDTGGGLGIDCCYQTVVHEFKHKWVSDNWLENEDWYGKSDSDSDSLCNDFENDYVIWVGNQGHYFDASDNDTYDIHEVDPAFEVYESYGDQELLVRIEATGKTISADKDWAFPGKQSDPPYDGNMNIRGSINPTFPLSINLDDVSEQAIDTDGDGKYNILRVTINITSNESKLSQIIATLFDGIEKVIDITYAPLYLEPGSQQVYLDFDGTTIRENNENGPFLLNISLYQLSYDSYLIDSKSISTGAYNWTDFQPQAARFNEFYTDQGIDNNEDGLYDNLLIFIGINVTTPGDYSVGATLYDDTGDIITNARNVSYLDVGYHNITLSYDGIILYHHGKNGPYILRYLGLSGHNQYDFILNAYNTSAYNITDFQKTSARFNGNYSDMGVDTDNNGLFEYLSVTGGINVTSAGNYTLSGSLYDSNESFIVLASNRTYLNVGTQSMQLPFNGSKIFHHGVNGQYIIGILTLLDQNGTVIDTQNNVYTTTTYNYYNFENIQPYSPNISGPTSGIIDTEYNYTILTLDPDEDDVYYYIDWDDGTTSSWLGPYISGQPITANHTWVDVGVFEITAKAKDIYDYESNWSEPLIVTIIEIQLPQIVDNTPTIGYTGDSFTFNTTVTDDTQVSTVWVEYWYGAGSHTSVKMNNVAGNYWEKTITIGNTLDILNYIITANDTFNNWNTTGTKNVEIYDNDNPEIYNVIADPLEQLPDRYVNISAVVIDNIKVNEVCLFIRYPDATIENISIVYNKTGNTYYCKKIYPQLGEYLFHIWANDTSGNAIISSEYSFKIRLNSPPYEPSNPNPENDSKDISVDTMLSWIGGDPDNDTVAYDVYFGRTSPPPKVASNQLYNFYNPGVLQYEETYYWQIVARDKFGFSTTGEIWHFTTKMYLNLFFFAGFINNKNDTGDYLFFKARLLFVIDMDNIIPAFCKSGEEFMISKQNQLGYIGKQVIIGIFEGASLSASSSSMITTPRDRLKHLVIPQS
jgi:hypothetical protein